MDIIGHQKILNFLDRTIKKNAVSQAYLFTGSEHTGKFTVALDFAKKILGRDQEIDADLFILKPEIEEKKGTIKTRDIKIESVRELIHWLSLATSGGGFRVAIIDNVERMTIESQNALLKSLEDANPQTAVILVAQSENKILPTIHSRCQRIFFGNVSPAEISQHIPENAKNKKEILNWSLGRPGLMQLILNNPAELEERIQSVKELENILAGNVAERFSYAEKMSKDIVLALKKLNFWLVAFRYHDLKIKNSFSAIEKIETGMALLKETNANPRLVIENLLLEL
ncbi:MAG: AAA family ATPase [Candidatus Moranbacteria bacterium]|nr:AAA family ATPase [Candidatus Moranbacteria bacterium]